MVYATRDPFQDKPRNDYTTERYDSDAPYGGNRGTAERPPGGWSQGSASDEEPGPSGPGYPTGPAPGHAGEEQGWSGDELGFDGTRSANDWASANRAASRGDRAILARLATRPAPQEDAPRNPKRSPGVRHGRPRLPVRPKGPSAVQVGPDDLFPLGRKLLRAHPLLGGLIAALTPSEVAPGTLTPEMQTLMDIYSAIERLSGAISEFRLGPRPEQFEAIIRPSQEPFEPLMAPVPGPLKAPEVDMPPRKVPNPLPAPRPVGDPALEQELFDEDVQVGRIDLPEAEPEFSTDPRRAKDDLFDVRFVIDRVPRPSRSKARRNVPRARPGIRIRRLPNGARTGAALRILFPRPRAHGKDGKNAYLYNLGLKVVNATYGTLTEVYDAVEVMGANVYAQLEDGTIVPAMSLDGATLYSTFDGLLSGEFELDGTGFVVDYAINQLSDVYWAMTDPIDVLQKWSPSWGAYRLGEEVQGRYKEEANGWLRETWSRAETSLRDFDTKRNDRVSSLFD